MPSSDPLSIVLLIGATLLCWVVIRRFFAAFRARNEVPHREDINQRLDKLNGR